MSTTTVSSKGQITLPAALLRERRIHPGTRLEVISTSTAIMLVQIDGPFSDFLAGSTSGLYGDVKDYVESERDDWA